MNKGIENPLNKIIGENVPNLEKDIATKYKRLRGPYMDKLEKIFTIIMLYTKR